MRPQQGARAALTTRIKIKNKEGKVVEEKEVATYAGLLAKAHDEGLRSIRTQIVHVPTKEHPLAIVSATVRTNKGIFSAIADATPANVNVKIAPHYIRMAETRAKARALRDAVNVGMLALEELGSLDEDFVEEGSPAHVPQAGNGGHQRPANDNGHRPGVPAGAVSPEFAPMSDPQRRLLFRIATERGIAPENVKRWLEAELSVPDLRALSRSAASSAIDQLREGQPNGTSPGNGTHTPAGATP